jgi:hypothetical protein
MYDDNYDFEIDPAGNRVLIGLSIEKNGRIFQTRSIKAGGLLINILRDELHSPEERRWLELFDEHTIAKLPFL